jgi:hypothetical protein
LEVLEELGIECRVIPLLGPAHLFSSLRAWRVNAGSTSRSYAFRLDSGKRLPDGASSTFLQPRAMQRA